MITELSRAEMLEDLQMAVETIEQVHPDPFLHCDGRVAFFNAVHEIARSLPEYLSVADFGIEVGKVTALVRDGHTFAYGFDDPDREGLVFGVWFTVVAGDLVLMGTHHHELTRWFGSRLRAVNGVPVAGLLGRLARLVGADNEVALATGLGARLRSPRWVGLLTDAPATPPATVTLGFIDPDGGLFDVSVAAMEPVEASPVTPSSSVDLPDFGRDAMGWAPMPGHPDTTYLRVRVCGDYREAYEVMTMTGNLTTADPFLARRFAARAVGGLIDPALIAEVPSASSFLGELCDAAEQSGSRRLIVDVRGNPGGQSVISLLMLVAFYGFETAVKAIPSYTIPRISRRLRDAHQVNWPHAPGPVDGDMDFTELDEVEAAVTAGAQSRELRAVLDGCPSLWTEVDARGGWPWWHPDKLLVLTDNGTYSSAYSITTDLCRAGAIVVGTPSGQSGNAFGDYTTFVLPRSGATLRVSYKVFRYWPDDPDRGHLLRPQIELTYDDLHAHHFDPNTAVTLALGIRPAAPPGDFGRGRGPPAMRGRLGYTPRGRHRVRYCQALSPDGMLVRYDEAGRPPVTDGPFAETKDLIAGWTVTDVDTYERALTGEFGAHDQRPAPRILRCRLQRRHHHVLDPARTDQRGPAVPVLGGQAVEPMLDGQPASLADRGSRTAQLRRRTPARCAAAGPNPANQLIPLVIAQHQSRSMPNGANQRFSPCRIVGETTATGQAFGRFSYACW